MILKAQGKAVEGTVNSKEENSVRLLSGFHPIIQSRVSAPSL